MKPLTNPFLTQLATFLSTGFLLTNLNHGIPALAQSTSPTTLERSDVADGRGSTAPSTCLSSQDVVTIAETAFKAHHIAEDLKGYFLYCLEDDERRIAMQKKYWDWRRSLTPFFQQEHGIANRYMQRDAAITIENASTRRRNFDSCLTDMANDHSLTAKRNTSRYCQDRRHLENLFDRIQTGEQLRQLARQTVCAQNFFDKSKACSVNPPPPASDPRSLAPTSTGTPTPTTPPPSPHVPHRNNLHPGSPGQINIPSTSGREVRREPLLPLRSSASGTPATVSTTQPRRARQHTSTQAPQPSREDGNAKTERDPGTSSPTPSTRGVQGSTTAAASDTASVNLPVPPVFKWPWEIVSDQAASGPAQSAQVGEQNPLFIHGWKSFCEELRTVEPAQRTKRLARRLQDIPIIFQTKLCHSNGTLRTDNNKGFVFLEKLASRTEDDIRAQLQNDRDQLNIDVMMFSNNIETDDKVRICNQVLQLHNWLGSPATTDEDIEYFVQRQMCVSSHQALQTQQTSSTSRQSTSDDNTPNSSFPWLRDTRRDSDSTPAPSVIQMNFLDWCTRLNSSNFKTNSKHGLKARYLIDTFEHIQDSCPKVSRVQRGLGYVSAQTILIRLNSDADARSQITTEASRYQREFNQWREQNSASSQERNRLCDREAQPFITWLNSLSLDKVNGFINTQMCGQDMMRQLQNQQTRSVNMQPPTPPQMPLAAPSTIQAQLPTKVTTQVHPWHWEVPDDITNWHSTARDKNQTIVPYGEHNPLFIGGWLSVCKDREVNIMTGINRNKFLAQAFLRSFDLYQSICNPDSALSTGGYDLMVKIINPSGVPNSVLLGQGGAQVRVETEIRELLNKDNELKQRFCKQNRQLSDWLKKLSEPQVINFIEHHMCADRYLNAHKS